MDLHHFASLLSDLNNFGSEIIRVSDSLTLGITWNQLDLVTLVVLLQVIGIQSWARQTALELAQACWTVWIVPGWCQDGAVMCSVMQWMVQSAMLPCFTFLTCRDHLTDRRWTNLDKLRPSDSHNMSQAQAAADKLDVKLREK